MNIKELAVKHADYIVDRRRFYHACPELSLQEKETIQKIRADLEAMGITDIRMMETCYGLIANIHGAKPGDAQQDAEGIRTVRNLAKNMSYMIKAFTAAKDAVELPALEPKAFTNFIR